MGSSHFYFFSLLLLFFTLLTTITTSAATQPTTPHDPIIKLNNKPSDQQIRNIIEAIMGTGDFRNWGGVLSAADPSTFPVSATLFIPSDGNSLSSITSTQFLQFDPSSFAYHIVPQQLTFSLLKTFKIGSRIPTLLTNKTILVTNNTEWNYTIDDSQITHPDLYINGPIAVHGIRYLLNYSVFGGGFLEDHQISNPGSPPPPDHSHELPDEDDHKNGHEMGLHRSIGQCLSAITYVKVFLWKVVLVLVFLVLYCK